MKCCCTVHCCVSTATMVTWTRYVATLCVCNLSCSVLPTDTARNNALASESRTRPLWNWRGIFTAASACFAVTWPMFVSIRRTLGISHRGVEGVTGSCRHWVCGATRRWLQFWWCPYPLFCCQMDKVKKELLLETLQTGEYLETARTYALFIYLRSNIDHSISTENT